MADDAVYGTDISCTTDVDGTGRTVTGPRLVAEALARRLITPRGRLIGDPDYGTDVTQYVNDDMTAQDIGALRSAVVAECLKDERVIDATCEASIANSKLAVTVTFEVGEGPFDLTISVPLLDPAALTVEL